MLKVFIFFTFFNSIAALAMALIGYVRNSTSRVHRLFILFNLSVALWSFGYAISLLAQDENTALFWTKSHNSFAILIPIFFAHFIIAFLGLRRKAFLVYGYSVTFIFWVLNFTNVYVDGVSRKFLGSFFPDSGRAVFLYIILGYLVITSYAIYCLFKQLQNQTGFKREQIKFMLIASMVGWIGGYTNFFLWFNFDILPYGNLFVSLYAIIFGYTMLRYRLMDVRLLVLRSIAYLVTFTIIGGTYVSITYFAVTKLERFISKPFFDFFLLFIAIFAFQPLKKIIQQQADKFFSISRYSFEDLLKKLSHILSTNLVLDNLAKNLIEVLENDLKANEAAFLLSSGFNLGKNKLTQKDKRKLFDMYQKKALVADELEDDSKTKILMQKLGTEVLIFFPDQENQPLGFLALSEKASGDAYTSRDLKLLEIIAPQISIALKNIEQQQQMIEKILEERQRINQDAHDRIYNRLGALAKKAEIALLKPKEAKPTLKLLKDDLSQSVSDLRKIVSGDFEDESNEALIMQELRRICDDFQKQSSINLTYSFDESLVDELKPQNCWHLQCILEECLNNIQKHSQATQAKVTLQAYNGSLVLHVDDDGEGFKKYNAKHQNHFGLQGMQERAQKINAELNISSNNGKGTKIELRIPC